ncbi:MAG: hypothetical protein FWC13_07820 [Oscillospiraceae bacterium]|nr:hypothetical protein [Oscillospiraceae bacterium]
MRNVLIVVIAVLGFAVVWFIYSALSMHALDVQHQEQIDHAVRLAEGRVEQAREVFDEHRSYLEVLQNSQELHAREVILTQQVIVSVRDETTYFAGVDAFPGWLTEQEISAYLSLVYSEIEGSREASLFFYGDTFTFQIFATPLHFFTPRAWVSLQYGDVAARDDRDVFYVGAISDGWYVSITSEIPSSGVTIYIIFALIATAMTAGAVAVLVWGIRTYRFLNSDNNTIVTVVIIAVLTLAFVTVSWWFLDIPGTTQDIGAIFR